jgi:hypothetical protein
MYRDAEARVDKLTEHSILRTIIYDSQIPNPEVVSRNLGLSPMSEELVDHERQESLYRCSKFMGMFGLIDMHSELLSRVMAASYSASLTEEESSLLNEATLAALEITFSTISRASIISWLTIMDSVGVVRRSSNE